MSLLALSCLAAGMAVAFDAIETTRQNRRVALQRVRSLAARHGLPEQP